MDWHNLLSPKRLGTDEIIRIDHERNSFQQDFDRIVFSASFRRLQDKTQVFSLTTPDYIRTRLTHSLETSCVGRSLGMRAGARVLEWDKALNTEFQTSDFGAITAAACLAHDIGNPPFGHIGEAAIGHWFANTEAGQEICRGLKKENSPMEEFIHFEGNAQGFRVLTQLEHQNRYGGLQLTCATLASFMKYPRSYFSPRGRTEHVAEKKYGYFESEHQFFQEVVEATGMGNLSLEGTEFLNLDLPFTRNARHPLAYLVEASDDICYRIVDIEDGYRQHLVEYSDAERFLTQLLPKPLSLDRIGEKIDRLEYLRARVIGELINQISDAFVEHYDDIMSGNLTKPLADVIPKSKELKDISAFAFENIYNSEAVHNVEVAGFTVLGKLIEIFLGALNERARNEHISTYTQIVLSLFSRNYYDSRKCKLEETTLYQRVQMVTDFVSSLTDRKAVSLFKQLTGISLADD